MLNNKKIKVSNLVIFIILFLGILPVIKLYGFNFPPQYFLIPILLVILSIYFIKGYKITVTAKRFIILFSLILISVLFSGFFSPLIIIGKFNFPREFLLYISRFTFFVIFITLFYKYDISYKTFMKILSSTLIIGMFIGIIQFYNIPFISNLFRELYSISEVHLGYMMRDEFVSKRITGVAHHGTSNGGIAVFTLIIILSYYIFNEKNYVLFILGLFTSVFNIIASQSRMGYLTMILTFFLLYLVYNKVYKKKIKSTVYLITLFASVTGILYYLYVKGNVFLLKAIGRWELLSEQIDAGENRLGQVYNAIAKLNTPYEYLFGISRGVQNTYDSFYIEVEPINILVLYGVVGFVLQYGLILLLLFYFYKNISYFKENKIVLTIIIASFVSLLSYQFFSFAFFFFRETVIGLYPWILMGTAIGIIEKEKQEKYNGV